MKDYLWKVYLVMSLFLLANSGCGSSELSRGNGITIAILGDQGTSENSKKVLEMIKKEHAELLIINGDFDYNNNAESWKKMNESILGKNFPIIAVAGNHDMSNWEKYGEIINKWEQNPKLSCTGVPGIESTCVYRGIKIISVTPGIVQDMNHTQYIQNSLKNDNSDWKICSWHKNMADMQTGYKTDETGWGVYEVCRENGALITTGHEHAYARTFLLSSIQNKTVADFNKSMITLEKGKTVVVLSGLGGISSRHKVKEGYWWANTQNADTGAKAGAFFCVFNIDKDPTRAQCYFKEIEQGIVDWFVLKRK